MPLARKFVTSGKPHSHQGQGEAHWNEVVADDELHHPVKEGELADKAVQPEKYCFVRLRQFFRQCWRLAARARTQLTFLRASIPSSGAGAPLSILQLTAEETMNVTPPAASVPRKKKSA